MVIFALSLTSGKKPVAVAVAAQTAVAVLSITWANCINGSMVQRTTINAVSLENEVPGVPSVFARGAVSCIPSFQLAPARENVSGLPFPSVTSPGLGNGQVRPGTEGSFTIT